MSNVVQPWCYSILDETTGSGVICTRTLQVHMENLVWSMSVMGGEAINSLLDDPATDGGEEGGSGDRQALQDCLVRSQSVGLLHSVQTTIQLLVR